MEQAAIPSNLPNRLRHVALAFAAAASFLCLPAWASDAGPRVVTSIRPLHGLVAAVMAGVGKPDLLVSGAQSPHHYSLTPSAARRLQRADVIFVTGLGLMPGLERAMHAVAAKAHIFDLSSTPGLELLEQRDLGRRKLDAKHGDHGHDDQDHRHEHMVRDPHYWLDPSNAKVMAAAIAAAMSTADRAHSRTYAANAAALSKDIDRLTEEAARALAPLRNRPFMVYHDAFQYLEKRFGLNGLGAIALTPETAPGAAHMRTTQHTISGLNGFCIFTEPGARPRLVETLISGTNTRVGILDPLGTQMESGPTHYIAMTSANISAMVECLSGD